MPVKRENRRVYALSSDLNLWLGRESAGERVRIEPNMPTLVDELKRGLSFVRKQTREHRQRRDGT